MRNTIGDDGCSADCTEQSRNFVCRVAGQPCERIVFCGDGRVAGDESCEDGQSYELKYPSLHYDPTQLEKAIQENVPILVSNMSAFELTGKIYNLLAAAK